MYSMSQSPEPRDNRPLSTRNEKVLLQQDDTAEENDLLHLMNQYDNYRLSTRLRDNTTSKFRPRTKYKTSQKERQERLEQNRRDRLIESKQTRDARHNQSMTRAQVQRLYQHSLQRNYEEKKEATLKKKYIGKFTNILIQLSGISTRLTHLTKSSDKVGIRKQYYIDRVKSCQTTLKHRINDMKGFFASSEEALSLYDTQYEENLDLVDEVNHFLRNPEKTSNVVLGTTRKRRRRKNRTVRN
jgi:hypothetical protein